MSLNEGTTKGIASLSVLSGVKIFEDLETLIPLPITQVYDWFLKAFSSSFVLNVLIPGKDCPEDII